MADGYEPVFTVKDFWDCPRSGVANYRGKPHLYECNFDEAKDDFSDMYQLTPLSADAFKLALEDWEIFNRWNEALQSGETDCSTHPCLPEDKSRHEELRRLLEPLLNTDVDKAVLARAKFVVLKRNDLPKRLMRPMKVEWTPV